MTGADGWDLGLSYWRPYDERMPWGVQADDATDLKNELEVSGRRIQLVEADLARPEAAGVRGARGGAVMQNGQHAPRGRPILATGSESRRSSMATYREQASKHASMQECVHACDSTPLLLVHVALVAKRRSRALADFL